LQLTVRDAARFLNVSESTVTRWVRRRGLPAQHVAGQYRFNRALLLEWATANQVSVAVEMLEDAGNRDEPVPDLADALEAGGIFYGLQGTDKARALQALVQVLPLPDDTDRELLLRLFLAREACASTAIGDGIALPHVRNPIVLYVARPLVPLCFLERPVNFGALDGKPVHVLFSSICPTIRSHLQMLARLSFALQNERFKGAVLRQAPRDEILVEARRIEAALRSRQLP
jgi:PTS system nitrogen regulatory IIA component